MAIITKLLVEDIFKSISNLLVSLYSTKNIFTLFNNLKLDIIKKINLTKKYKINNIINVVITTLIY